MVAYCQIIIVVIITLTLLYVPVIVPFPVVLVVDAFAAVTPRSKLPPPPCPTSNPSDDVFRKIRRSWPVPLQNWLTEKGVFRFLADSLVIFGIPGLIKEYPDAFWDFFHLSTSSAFKTENDELSSGRLSCRSRLTKIQYGEHKSQFIDLIEPIHRSPDGVVAFVHGGAWGSGLPWMYRLSALPFLEQNKAVAILGYRTYPDADLSGQVSDISKAVEGLARRRSDLLDDEGRVTAVVGHSSGAHIALLHVLDSAKNTMQGASKSSRIKHYVGISGVYCISSHYQFEIGRGVDQISALRVACGPEDKFKEASPDFRLARMMGVESTLPRGEDVPLIQSEDIMPAFSFFHGVQDDVVQYVQTCDMVDSIRLALRNPSRCRECILDDVGHADTVIHLMVGGATRDALAKQCQDW